MSYGFQFQESTDADKMAETKVTRRGRRGCMTSGMCCIRTTLVTFNLGTGLAGVCLAAVGLMLFLSSSSSNLSGLEFLGRITQSDRLPNYGEFRGFSILCMIVGSLVAFISFVGCFGACVNSRCLLMTYLISVAIVVMLQFFVSVFAIIYRQPVSNSVREELLLTLTKEYQLNNITMQTWDTVHQQFGCCGVDGFSDWFESGEGGEQVVPDSCCLNVQPDCGRSLEPSRWQKNGCLAEFQIFILKQLHLLAFAIVGIVFLQLYGIIASTLLFYHIRTPKSPKAFAAYRYERAKM
ncbi:CD63 antigen [Orchesella cincta]|uniref:Tetraspanin n=1 Tax=Orchesella cincta TaxID=48709 RepID=A0A1D2N725_ORCCI|nr:CD63 antigen [Orchesella cincta]